MVKLGKYSMGLGDRFGHQGEAQLNAIIAAAGKGIEITPVWNKSNREHITIGTNPSDVRTEADAVTKKCGFIKPYFVDADHINSDTVTSFIACSDFFTIDVASFIGKHAEENEIEEFLRNVRIYTGILKIPGLKAPYETSRTQIKKIAEKYLFAILKAWEIYRKIEKAKGKGNFIIEVSMDEVNEPQTPLELFFILKMISMEAIPLQTIAPKFTGRFNKGVDYAGDPMRFAEEFESDLMVIDYAVKEFGLPEDLKMSVHSGSDKFAIYPHIGTIIRNHKKGIHIKTAGTTWLEEVIGLSLSGGEALTFVKEIYAESLGRIDELTAPYSGVIDINMSLLPSEREVSGWDSRKFSESVRHIPGNHNYNPNMRQLIHVAYKLAAHRMDEFNHLLEKNNKLISKCVFENIYDRHICRLFNI